MSVENERYSEFMGSLLDIRFSKYKDAINGNILELMKYASFGIPRIFIFLIHSFQNSSLKEKTLQGRVWSQHSRWLGVKANRSGQERYNQHEQRSGCQIHDESGADHGSLGNFSGAIHQCIGRRANRQHERAAGGQTGEYGHGDRV